MLFIARSHGMTRKIAFGWAIPALALVLSGNPAPAQSSDHLQETERLLARAQRVCPVTGKDLRSMGGPVKAEVDGQTVFLCCQGCVGRAFDSEHWAGIQKRLHMARLVLAQEICPVTGKDLLSMGGPTKAELGGQTVFLCCKGCLQRQVQQQHWEQIQVNLAAAQGRCPVMDKPLPKNPTSTLLEGQRIFVCCPPCTKKFQADPETYLARVDRLVDKHLTQPRADQ